MDHETAQGYLADRRKVDADYGVVANLQVAPAEVLGGGFEERFGNLVERFNALPLEGDNRDEDTTWRTIDVTMSESAPGAGDEAILRLVLFDISVARSLTVELYDPQHLEALRGQPARFQRPEPLLREKVTCAHPDYNRDYDMEDFGQMTLIEQSMTEVEAQVARDA